jgi:hypothetical protein
MIFFFNYTDISNEGFRFTVAVLAHVYLRNSILLRDLECERTFK